MDETSLTAQLRSRKWRHLPLAPYWYLAASHKSDAREKRTASLKLPSGSRSCQKSKKRLRDVDWFSLSKRDRPHASVSMALEFFFRRDEFPAQLRDEEIAQFLERRITTPVEGTTIDNYVYGIACVLALSFPDPVLRVLRSKPDDRGSLSVLDAFLVHGYDSHHLSTVIFQFFNIYRTEPDGFDNPEDTLQAISDAVDQILADGIYRALYFAW
jgi:hypothetical protein